MKERGIILIGSGGAGFGKSVLLKSMIENEKTHAIAVKDSKPVMEQSVFDPPSIPIRNYHALHQMPESKPNPKKPHKHQYKKKVSDWVCDCGRKLYE